MLFAIFTFLFALNVIAFGAYAIDKRNAVYALWRIPEAVLLGLAIVGGAYGAGAAMMIFRHKTRHTSFLVTVPLFFILWMVALVIICITNR